MLGEGIFSTRESKFHNRMFQTNIEGQSGIKYPIFPVPIGYAKETGKIEYDLKAPLVAYHHNSSNISCFSSLVSAFTASGESKYARDIEIRTEESLNFQYQGYKDRIAIDNIIMSDQAKTLGDQLLHYNIKK